MVAQQDKEKTSSSQGQHKIELYLRAGPYPEVTRSAEPHEELANLRDDHKAVRAFESRWGPLTKPPEMADPDFYKKFPAEMLKGLGGGLPIGFRDTLREAWKTDPAWLDEMQDISEIPNSLVRIHDSVARQMLSTWEFRNGRIAIIPDNLWTSICVLFLRDHAAGRTCICANPDCANPFFLKKRGTQKYCEAGPCVAHAQRQYALRWWNAEGKKRRSKKHSKARNRGRKTR